MERAPSAIRELSGRAEGWRFAACLMLAALCSGLQACSSQPALDMELPQQPAAAAATGDTKPSATPTVTGTSTAGRAPSAPMSSQAGTAARVPATPSTPAQGGAGAAATPASAGSTAAGSLATAGAGGAQAGAGGAQAGAGMGGNLAAAGGGGKAGQAAPAAGSGGMGEQAGAAQSGAGQGAAGSVDYGAPGPYTVAIEKNVGASFRNTGVYDDTLQCEAFIAGAATGDSDPMVIEELTSYPADMDRALYTLFRPETFAEGQKYPVITWGNGTCSHPLLFEELLKHLASHGFIVVASNWRWVASGREMLRGIDFILSENENEDSALFGKIDTKSLGATGHSQGSGATVVVGADARIIATVPIQGASAADVARLKGPTFLIAGDRDTLVSPESVETAFDAATVPAVFGIALGHDHLMPGLAPAPILKPITTWFKIQLSADAAARDFFYGDACGLCFDATWTVQRKNL